MNTWDKVYYQNNCSSWYPITGIVKFVARYIRKRTGVNDYQVRKEVKRSLDIGCGNGNHLVFLAAQGFKVYGIDISGQAVKMAKLWLKKQKLTAQLKIGDITKSLPYKDNYFDLVISHGVLDHISFLRAKRLIGEVGRILAPNGYLFITLRSSQSSEYRVGKHVGKNTIVLQKGYEKGLIQHFFDIKEISELLEGFKVFDIELHQEKFPSCYTLDKAFLQSSKGFKQYVDLKEKMDFSLNDSRWYVAAEKIKEK